MAVRPVLGDRLGEPVHDRDLGENDGSPLKGGVELLVGALHDPVTGLVDAVLGGADADPAEDLRGLVDVERLVLDEVLVGDRYVTSPPMVAVTPSAPLFSALWASASNASASNASASTASGLKQPVAPRVSRPAVRRARREERVLRLIMFVSFGEQVRGTFTPGFESLGLPLQRVRRGFPKRLAKVREGVTGAWEPRPP
ncbi:hypothetical protein HFP72_14860 [Nocardiopsis sp. ARC36]